MNKEFEYRNHKFNINIKLNTRRLNGELWHTVTTNCMDYDNYYKVEEVNDKFIEVYVQDCERHAKGYIDEKLDGKPSPHKKLSELGFN